MKHAEFLPENGWLPTRSMVAFWLFNVLEFILSEIKSLTWMNLMTKSQIKIIVTNLSIFIYIKFIIYFFELFICHFDTPMIEIIFQFFWWNTISSNFLVHVFESFSYCFPLAFYFIYYHSLQLIGCRLFNTGTLENFIFFSLFFLAQIEPWIFDGVMPEVKAVTLVNTVS